MSYVRYCPECGHVGDVNPPARDCCPTAKPAVIPEAIATQARAGFHAGLTKYQEKHLLYPPQMTFWQAFQAGLIVPKKDPVYLRWLHTLPCAVTGTTQEITVHHTIGHGLRGHTDKTCDFMSFPVTARLHLPDYPQSIHAMNYGWKRWEEAHGSQLVYTLQTLMRAIHAGVLKRV